MAPADKTIVSHHGALGDFLCAWPALRALASAERAGQLCFDGPASRLRWLRPLGFQPVDADQTRGLRKLHADDAWPEELEDARVLRFCLDRPPDFPGLARHAAAGRLGVIPSLDPAGFAPPRDVHRHALAGLGCAVPDGWLADFRRRFAAHRRPRPGRILLVPGAGHRLKRWPLVQFFALARVLTQRGLDPLFVLGPAEAEQGLDTGGFPTVASGDLDRLEGLLLEAEAVVGVDCGPMHLAGMLGIPGVGLFGPTSRRQWGPPGLRLLAGVAPCRPCSRTTRSLRCGRPRCLETLPAEEVLAAMDGVRRTK
jgi:ADP-heptose:LPS heptosyltransferase